MAKDDDRTTVRGVPKYEWSQAVASAKRHDQAIGEWLTDAIREKLAREHEPIDATPAQVSAWRLSIVEVHALWETHRWAAETRRGRYKGRIRLKDLARLRPALEAVTEPLPPRQTKRLTASDTPPGASDAGGVEPPSC
jgi:hypothetical protein